MKACVVMLPVAGVEGGGLTGPGSAEGAPIADDDQVVVVEGQLPLGANAYRTEPGVADDVAQFTYTDVCVRSDAYGALARLALNPL